MHANMPALAIYQRYGERMIGTNAFAFVGEPLHLWGKLRGREKAGMAGGGVFQPVLYALLESRKKHPN